MALKPYDARAYSPATAARAVSSGYVLRARAEFTTRGLIGSAVLAVVCAILIPVMISFERQRANTGTEFIPFLVLLGALIVWSLVRLTGAWLRQRRLEPAELLLSAWPVRLAQPLGLRFKQRLKDAARIPNGGRVEWRLTCAEITKTTVGTDTTYSSHVLWSADLPAQPVSSGASSFEARAQVTLPSHLPATLEPRGSSWIEWRLQVAPYVAGFNIESVFRLLVQ